MISNLWNRFLHLSEPVIVLLIRVCGWSSILLVFAIFFFILGQGAPFLTNKLRYEFETSHVAERKAATTLAYRFSDPKRLDDLSLLLERLFARGGLAGVEHAWLSTVPDPLLWVDLVEGADAKNIESELSIRVRALAKTMEDPDKLALQRVDLGASGEEFVYVTPFRSSDSALQFVSTHRVEGKLSQVKRLFAELSERTQGRVLVRLDPGTDKKASIESFEAVVPMRAIVLSELPYENPEEITIEKIESAMHAGKIQGAADVSLESKEGHVYVVIDLLHGGEFEAVTNELLAAVPMRQNFAQLTSFFGSSNWRPDSDVRPSFGILALIAGTFSVTLLSLALSVPISLGTSIFISEFCHGKLKEAVKILIELLAAIPSVVWGFIGYMIMNPLIIWATGRPIGINMLNGGIVLAFMSIPIMVSLSEDALKAVPDSYREAGIALGASRWQIVYKVLLPAAKSGLLAAVLLGVGRTIGETMAVLMVTGHAVNLPTSVFDPVRTMTATIAAEMGEAHQGGDHYQSLFVIGTFLMILATTINLVADLVVRGVRGRQHG